MGYDNESGATFVITDFREREEDFREREDRTVQEEEIYLPEPEN